MKLSDTQRRVLKWIKRGRANTPKGCRCSYRTFVALQRAGLIRVDTTFSSVAVPQNARAELTERGSAAIFTLSKEPA